MSDAFALHPFDAALQLEVASENRYVLATDETYWNMAGPFGGWILAAGVKTVSDHPEARGEPHEAHARFFATPKPGKLDLRVELQAQGRSVGFWKVQFWQVQASKDRLCAEVSVLLAEQRDTVDIAPVRMPNVPPAAGLRTANTSGAHLRWLRHYQFRYIRGAPFRVQLEEGATPDLTSMLWVSDAQPRQLDWAGLAAFADVVAPRPFLIQKQPSPVATVALSLYFHASGSAIAESGPWLLLNISTHSVRAGFFDHAVELWGEDGRLLATSTQLAWFSSP